MFSCFAGRGHGRRRTPPLARVSPRPRARRPRGGRHGGPHGRAHHMLRVLSHIARIDSARCLVWRVVHAPSVDLLGRAGFDFCAWCVCSVLAVGASAREKERRASTDARVKKTVFEKNTSERWQSLFRTNFAPRTPPRVSDTKPCLRRALSAQRCGKTAQRAAKGRSAGRTDRPRLLYTQVNAG